MLGRRMAQATPAASSTPEIVYPTTWRALEVMSDRVVTCGNLHLLSGQDMGLTVDAAGDENKPRSSASREHRASSRRAQAEGGSRFRADTTSPTLPRR